MLLLFFNATNYEAQSCFQIRRSVHRNVAAVNPKRTNRRPLRFRVFFDYLQHHALPSALLQLYLFPLSFIFTREFR